MLSQDSGFVDLGEDNFMYRRNYNLVLVLLMSALVLVACKPLVVATQPPPTPIPSESPVPQEPEATPAVRPAPTETMPAQAEIVVPKPGRRYGLAATDPASVNLGGGTPVLVEFFAFW